MIFYAVKVAGKFIVHLSEECNTLMTDESPSTIYLFSEEAITNDSWLNTSVDDGDKTLGAMLFDGEAVKIPITIPEAA